MIFWAILSLIVENAEKESEDIRIKKCGI